ncbi:MAG: hypothetical protein M1834_005303 [Cirrosporium novae-zelandiae]|nr:MAG: hypothetical protein M1834_005303 [Cirrosporium novae-zelandiae]
MFGETGIDRRDLSRNDTKEAANETSQRGRSPCREAAQPLPRHRSFSEPGYKSHFCAECKKAYFEYLKRADVSASCFCRSFTGYCLTCRDLRIQDLKNALETQYILSPCLDCFHSVIHPHPCASSRISPLLPDIRAQIEEVSYDFSQIRFPLEGEVLKDVKFRTALLKALLELDRLIT